MKMKRKNEVYSLWSNYKDITPKNFYRLSAISMTAMAQNEATKRQQDVFLCGEKLGGSSYEEQFYPVLIPIAPRVLFRR